VITSVGRRGSGGAGRSGPKDLFCIKSLRIRDLHLLSTSSIFAYPFVKLRSICQGVGLQVTECPSTWEEKECKRFLWTKVLRILILLAGIGRNT